jgi:hypothetical protein
MPTWLEEAGRDLRYAIRALDRHRTLTVTVILTLALGIGSTTRSSA